MKPNKLNLGKTETVRFAAIEWELKNGCFSMCGDVRYQDGGESGGQNLEEIAKLYPHNKRVQRMVAIWREWHLNDLTAGSPAQEAWLKANKDNETLELNHWRNGYDNKCHALAEAGLNPDPNYLHNGKPYKYGHAWLKRELPANLAAEIESWSTPTVEAA